MERVFYSVPEVASALAVGRSTVYELMKSGELKSAKIRDRRVIPVESVQAFKDALLRAA
jgi:excisionase family DNA binding protein